MVNSIMSAGYTQIVSNAQPKNSQSNSGSSSSVECNKRSESFGKSNGAEFLYSRFTIEGGDTISVSSIEEAFSNAKSYVEQKLQALYGQLGISSNSKLEISVGADGSIIVNGDSPESESIAEAINADDELSNAIRAMSANASLLKAIEKHEEFAAAYDRDPLAAVERYGWLLEDGHGYNVSFSMQNGHIDTKVQYI